MRELKPDVWEYYQYYRRKLADKDETAQIVAKRRIAQAFVAKRLCRWPQYRLNDAKRDRHPRA